MQPEKLTIPGPAGGLEAVVETPDGWDGTRFAVVCHPHPLYGGALTNKVVHTVARAFNDLGVATIRFNFRGVGSSEGAYDHGNGETEDALAVVAWGQQRWPDAKLWLGGFSFGGGIAIRTAARTSPSQLVAVAPAVRLVNVEGVQPQCPWLIIQGDADETVDPKAVLDWAARLDPQPQVVMLPGVEHFFHGRLHDLRIGRESPLDE